MDGQPLSDIDLSSPAGTRSTNLTVSTYVPPSGRTADIQLETPKKASPANSHSLKPVTQAGIVAGVVLGGFILFRMVSGSASAPVADTPGEQPESAVPQAVAAMPVEDAPTDAPTTEPSSDQTSGVNSDIQTLIERWQEVKQKAYLGKDSSQLNSVLAEPALSIRREGIAYWQNGVSRTYYSLNLNELSVQNIELKGEDQALATVKVRESHSTSEGNKDVDGVFQYFLIKQSGTWYINDIRQVE